MLPAFVILVTRRIYMKGYKNVGHFKMQSLNIPQSKRNNKYFQTTCKNSTDSKIALLKHIKTQQKSKGDIADEM